MFSIQFDPTSPLPDDIVINNPNGPPEFVKGYIDFGVEKETQRREEWFISPLHFWSVQDYERHWKEALERMVHGQDRSALIVSLGSLMRDDYVNWWPMWRIGETIKLQEHLLFLSRLKQPFDPANPYVHIGEYDNEADEDGQRASEWEVSLADMAVFLEAQEPRIEIRG